MKVIASERNYVEYEMVEGNVFKNQYCTVYQIGTHTEHFKYGFTIIYYEEDKRVYLIAETTYDDDETYYFKAEFERCFSKQDVEKLLTDGYHLSRLIMSDDCSNNDRDVARYLLEEEMYCMQLQINLLIEKNNVKSERIYVGTTENNILQHELAKKEKENEDLKMLVKLMKEYGDLNESKRN